MSHLIRGRFVALPETTRKSKQWKQFTPATREVYFTMLSKYIRKGNGSANGRVKWKLEELAKEAGVSKITIIRSLADLKEKDWISVWEPGGRWLDGTTYHINPVYADGIAAAT